MINMRHHPKALSYLFLTEMWERFGFYVVQGMLVLYLTKGFGFTDNKSYTISGLFTALAYISPMVGGFLADAFLGFEVAILWGGVFLIAGYAMLAFLSLESFYFALATIIIGTGLFKPNISSLLGTLYRNDENRRDSGFTIFYIGINVGILLSGSSGIIKNYLGWNACFAFASAGLIVSLITFGIGIKTGAVKLQENSRPVSRSTKFYLHKPFLIFYCVMAAVLLGFLLQSKFLDNWLLPTVGVALLIFMFMLAQRQEAYDRQRLYVLNILIISSIVFWALFWQMFFSVNLFVDRLVDRQILGMHVPTTLFYTLESIFIISFGPALAWCWQTLNEANRNPSSFLKFVSAIVCAGLGFAVLALSTYFYNSEHLVHPLWIVLAYFFITTGEMLLSPIGLSSVTLLSPPRLTGMMMGIWFSALGFGGQFAGELAKLSSVEGVAHDAMAQLPVYRAAFLKYAVLAFGVATFLFLLKFFLRKVLSYETMINMAEQTKSH